MWAPVRPRCQWWIFPGSLNVKILRFVSSDGEVCHGSPAGDTLETAYLISGDIFGDFTVTSSRIPVKKILPPVSPPNILALGLNYRKHADETGIRYPDIPVLFLKSTSSVIGHGDPVVLPTAGAGEVDYEAELGIIIGKETRNVSTGTAMEYILGYTCVNDVSARDWQIKKQKKQWARGKSFDTFCPAGPCLVTSDDILNPNDLRIQCIVNGDVLQDSSTSDMIFDVPAIVSDLSRSMTLLPGTLILTGTPEGVGFTRRPPVFLKDGDTVSVTIEKIGTLTNPVVREASSC